MAGKKLKRRRKRQKQLLLIAIISIAFVTVIAAGSWALRKNALEVTVNGKSIGIIKETKISSEDIINTVTAQISGDTGGNIKINESVELAPIRAGKNETVSVEHIISQVKAQVTYEVEAGIITVDGVEAVSLASKSAAEAVLNSLIDEYKTEGAKIVESGFSEDVSIITGYMPPENVVTKEEALIKLKNSVVTQKRYIVSSGDSLYTIAKENGTTVSDILKSNPKITADTMLYVGQELLVSANTPFVSVKIVEETTKTEAEPKITEFRQDETKLSSYKKIVQAGSDGEKTVTIRTTKINGIETASEVVKEEVTKSPVKEIIVVGTK